MNLRTSFVLSLVSVVWVAACVFAAIETKYNHPCLTKYPGTGTGSGYPGIHMGCEQFGCRKLNPDNPEDTYYYRTFGIEYKKCGSTEYFLNCEQEEPLNPLCAVCYLYVDEDTCKGDVAGDNCHPGELIGSRSSDVPSCREYSWQ